MLLKNFTERVYCCHLACVCSPHSESPCGPCNIRAVGQETCLLFPKLDGEHCIVPTREGGEGGLAVGLLPVLKNIIFYIYHINFDANYRINQSKIFYSGALTTVHQVPW